MADVELQEHSTRFIAFYSFKGGVGRSMTLANIAYLLARKGRKVMILDMDLEAPGQHRSDLFDPEYRYLNARDKRKAGLRGLMEGWEQWVGRWGEQDLSNVPPFEWDLIQHATRSDSCFDGLNKPPPGGYGEVWLLPPSRLTTDHAQWLEDLDWKAWYATKHGAAFFAGLRLALADQGFDDVLIDSRTGFSDASYISLLTLADSVVILTGLNRQNIEGTQTTLEYLRSPPVCQAYGSKPLFLVLSPVPIGFASTSDIARRMESVEREGEWSGALPRELMLPYVPELAFSEDVRCRQLDRSNTASLEADTYCLTMLRLLKGIDGEIDISLGETTHVEKLSNPFTRTRADYATEREWVPYYVDPGRRIADALESSVPTIVEGARGTGKTMLARNYSYEADVVRQNTQNKVQRVGLYFRLDVDLLRIFDMRELELRKTYDELFGQFWDLLILRKALEGLKALGGSELGISYWLPKESQPALLSRLLREMGRPSPQPKEGFVRVLAAEIEDSLSEARLYLNNPSRMPKPIRIQSNILLKLLVEELRRHPVWSDRYFVVLVDEYENFRPYQQRLVNTRLKQSKAADAVTYKLFIRHGGLHTADTESPDQRIQSVHDYRRFVLDENLSYKDFKEHARKVVERHFELATEFRLRGVERVEDFFDSISAEAEAQRLLKARRVSASNPDEIKARARSLESWVEKHPRLDATEKRTLLAWLLQEPSALRRAVVVVLVNQGKPTTEVLDEFSRNTARAQDWYHNFHRGALYWLCSLRHADKIYAGFNDLVGLAGYNLRYLLDMCFEIAAAFLSLEPKDQRLPISVSDQNRVLKHKPDGYMRILLEEGPYSEPLQKLVERLGRVFEACYKSPKQSEPEINHFALRGDLSEDAAKLLRAAYQAAVLRRLPETKQKSLEDLRGDAWQLHPRFAPKFKIGWRKKKQLVLKVSEFETIAFGPEQQWRAWLKLLEQRLSLDDMHLESGQGLLTLEFAERDQDAG